MGLRIRSNVSSLTAQRTLENTSMRIGKNYESMSSGKRINRAADDAAGLAISERLRGHIRGTLQAKRNANDGISLIQTAEGAMEEMANIIIRLRELNVQAASDTVGDRERSFLNGEYVQLVDEIDRIAASTEFNGNKFFLPEQGLDVFNIQVGFAGSEEDAENDPNVITIDTAGMHFDSTSLGLGKGAEIGAIEGDEGPSRSDISAKLENLDNALNRIAGERAILGSKQSRMEKTVNQLSISRENMENARSRIQDVDFAEITAEMAQDRVLQQANTAVLAQANQKPDIALNLLR